MYSFIIDACKNTTFHLWINFTLDWVSWCTSGTHSYAGLTCCIGCGGRCTCLHPVTDLAAFWCIQFARCISVLPVSCCKPRQWPSVVRDGGKGILPPPLQPPLLLFPVKSYQCLWNWYICTEVTLLCQHLSLPSVFQFSHPLAVNHLSSLVIRDAGKGFLPLPPPPPPPFLFQVKSYQCLWNRYTSTVVILLCQHLSLPAVFQFCHPLVVHYLSGLVW